MEIVGFHYYLFILLEGPNQRSQFTRMGLAKKEIIVGAINHFTVPNANNVEDRRIERNKDEYFATKILTAEAKYTRLDSSDATSIINGVLRPMIGECLSISQIEDADE